MRFQNLCQMFEILVFFFPMRQFEKFSIITAIFRSYTTSIANKRSYTKISANSCFVFFKTQITPMQILGFSPSEQFLAMIYESNISKKGKSQKY